MKSFAAWSTLWVVVVAVANLLGGLECLDPLVTVSPNSGTVHYCSSEGCGAEDVLVDLKSFEEYDDQHNPVKGVQDFGLGSVYALQDAAMGDGNPVDQHFAIHISTPTDRTSPACALSLPCGTNPAVFTYQVDHLASTIPLTEYDMYSGAESVVVFTFEFMNWGTPSPLHSFVLEFQIGLNVDSASPVYLFSEQEFDGFKRFTINDDLFVVLPIAGYPLGSPVGVQITRVGSYGHFAIAMPQTDTDARFKYQMLLVSHLPSTSSTGSSASGTTAVVPPVTTPAPTTAAPTKPAPTQLVPSTRMNMFASSRSFELCFSPTCSVKDGASRILLGALGIGIAGNVPQVLNFQTTALNFTAPTVFTNGANITRISSTLEMTVPTQLSSDSMLLLKVNISHIWESEHTAMMDSVSAPAGALKITLNVRSGLGRRILSGIASRQQPGSSV